MNKAIVRPDHPLILMIVGNKRSSNIRKLVYPHFTSVLMIRLDLGQICLSIRFLPHLDP